MNAPLPENEEQRLKALYRYQILDTSPEQAYDDFTHLISTVCQAPIAFITMVDSERLWFKSKVGLDLTETPREHGFCAHTILQSNMLVVPDMTIDERFTDNILVTSDPFIKFYAGAPLITPDGHQIGSLCVIDYVPRELSSGQLAAIEALSRQVVTQLELRAALNTIKTLRGLLPLCSYCKKIRDDANYWQEVDSYITEHSEAQVSHSICPICYEGIVKPSVEDFKRRLLSGENV